MNKKVILGLGALVVVGASGFALTRALFTDTETSGANTFTAGTLDMSVGGANGEAFESFSIPNLGVDGQVSGGKTWTIVNNGTVPGLLTFKMNDLVNNENQCEEPELNDLTPADDTCGVGPDQGELGGVISTVVLLDDVEVVNTNLANDNQDEYEDQWNLNAVPVEIPAGGSVVVEMDWSTNPATYTNSIQGDSLAFGLQFDLVQVVPAQE